MEPQDFSNFESQFKGKRKGVISFEDQIKDSELFSEARCMFQQISDDVCDDCKDVISLCTNYQRFLDHIFNVCEDLLNLDCKNKCSKKFESSLEILQDLLTN